MAKGSATHSIFKRSGKGTVFHSIYLKSKSDKNAFYDASKIYDMSKKYGMLKEGYALIRPINEIQSLMEAYPCKIVYPARGLEYDIVI